MVKMQKAKRNNNTLLHCPMKNFLYLHTIKKNDITKYVIFEINENF
jgi:hypothetical protein